MHLIAEYLSQPPQTLLQTLFDFELPSISFGWSWAEQSLGICRAFEDLGMVALVIGPIFVYFDYGI